MPDWQKATEQMETICCQGRILNDSEEKRGVLQCGKGTVYVCFKEYPMFQVVA